VGKLYLARLNPGIFSLTPGCLFFCV